MTNNDTNAWMKDFTLWAKRVADRLEQHLIDGGMPEVYDFACPAHRERLNTIDAHDYLYEFYAELPWHNTSLKQVINHLLADHAVVLAHWSLLFDFDLAGDLRDCLKTCDERG